MIPVVATNDAGNYFVVATNSVNSVTSSIVTLSVVADTNGPALLQADGTLSNNVVLVSFTELVLPSTATNMSNYRITNTLGGLLTISSAVLTNGSNVLLTTTSPRLINNNYILIASNVRDVSPRTNAIIANSMMPISSKVTVLGMNGGWRFYDPYPPFDAPDLGTAWREFAYTETNTWGAGSAVFYDGPDSGSVPAQIGSFLSQTPEVIMYFRTAFNLQASPGGLQFFVTRIVDDGMVLYLNGTESLRVNMPSGTINYNTPASAAVGNISRIGPVEITLPSYRIGSNVLAAELHQLQAADIDKAFGLQLDAKVESFVVGPVVITSGPTDQTIIEGQPATFTVRQVGGTTFQWQSNNVSIAGATNGTYTIPSVTTNMQGALYRVAVSNATAGVFSTNATLRVLVDTNPPSLVKAVFASGNSIRVTYSEAMAVAAAQTIGNYLVTNSAGAAATITSAVLQNGTNVLLTFSSTLSGRQVVVVNNVTDASSRRNVIPANSAVSVGADFSVELTSAWKALVLINTNEEIQTSFASPSYNDSAWSGPSNALLYVEGAALPAPKNTELSLLDGSNNRINTYYFRQKFVAAVGVNNLTVRIRHVVDDGLVLHLNGAEILRFNMPGGTVTAATQASGAIGDAALVGPIDVVINLLPGTNVLAAEVHQSGGASSDVVFGVELVGDIPSTVILPPEAVQIVEQPRGRYQRHRLDRVLPGYGDRWRSDQLPMVQGRHGHSRGHEQSVRD